MKEKLLLFVKGMILGVAFIIPGVSGGSLAVLLGIYEELLEAISNFYKSLSNFKKYFMYILPIGLGAVFSLVVCARIIKYGLSSAPIITILIFLGLILGGIPKIFDNVNTKKMNIKHISLMLIADKSSASVNFDSLNALSIVKLFFVGVLASATMVVPGISGSFTLMLIGYYEPILEVINNLSSFNNVSHNLLILVPLAIGAIVGIMVIAKIINYLLNKYSENTYYVIIGFVLASVISILFEVFKCELNTVHLIVGTILLFVNTYLIYKVSYKIK